MGGRGCWALEDIVRGVVSGPWPLWSSRCRLGIGEDVIRNIFKSLAL